MKPAAAQSTVDPRASRRGRRRWRRALLGIGGASLLAAVACWLAIDRVPLPPALFEPPPAPPVLEDRHGRPLRSLRDDAGFAVEPVVLAGVPQSLIDATLAAEDKRFWSHPGVDWRATLRAARDFLRHRRAVSGASTITQQLVKLADPRPRTVATKLVEAVRALRLERVWTKQQILEAYLNRIDYGSLCRGSAAAATFYFDKPLSRLTVAEAALLAGLPQAPSRLNPHLNAPGALRRQRWILDRMAANGWLSPVEHREAAAQPVRFAPPGRAFHAPHFVDLLLERETREPTFPATGRVRTTLDLELQAAAQTALRRQLALLTDRRARHGAVIVLENVTGDVLAWVGSPDYFSPEAGQVNGGWAARSAGSTLKPFTYLLAFEQGAGPASIVADVPSSFPTATGVFTPVNYDRRFHGPMAHRRALANSLNVAAVRVLEGVGGPAPLLERLQACGLTTLTRPADHYGLGLTIGNAGVRLVELVNAYACLARSGWYRPWRLTPAEPGTGLVSDRRLFRADHAWLITDILSDNQARQLAFGLASPLEFPFPVAVKTGTSTDFRDNWAVGFTPEFTVGVWIGNFDGSPMREVSGVSGAAPVLQDLFHHLHDRYGTTRFPVPDGIVHGRVHPVTGHRISEPAAGSALADETWRIGVPEVWAADASPPPDTPADHDALGRVRLDLRYAAWLAGGDNWLGQTAVLDHADGATRPLRITWPQPDTVFFLDPDLPHAGARVRLQAEGGDSLIWTSETLDIENHAAGAWAHLREGRHRLEVVDDASRSRQITEIEVRRL